MRRHFVRDEKRDRRTGELPRERRLADIERILDRTLRRAGVPDDEGLAVTFGVPAPVDADGRSPVGDIGFWSAMNPGLGDRFAARGWSAAPVRHGVSTVRSGRRFTLGLVFHDAS